MILMVDGSDRGGIALYTADLLAALRARRVPVSLSAPGDRAVDAPALPAVPWGEQVAGWSPLRRRVVETVARARRAIVLAKAVRSLRPDIVHLQTPVTGPLDPLLLRWIGRRAVIVRTVHNAVPHEDTRAGRRDVGLWRLADHLVVHGMDAASHVAGAGRPISVIPPDLPRGDAPGRASARSRLGVGKGPIALLLGLLRPYKGVGLLADAWPGVRHLVPGATLVVAGSALERFADLDRLVALDGVDARIGWLDDVDVLAWAAAADVCLLPYAHGSHSAVMHRAVLGGTPVLASPALAVETRRLRAGRVVPLDAAAWSAAIAQALVTPLPAPAPPPAGAQATATAQLYERLTA